MADGDSQPSPSTIFSVRIVSIDYYMAPPVPDLDISYSSFQGGKVNEVPVIRIFGPTPAGQKTCLHVHRALPYLYVPCKDIPLQLNQEGDSYANAIAFALEKALKLKGKAGSKRKHVHACSLVRAKKFYGYHSSEELFVKIYLYYPQDVSRAASLLLGGAVLDKSLQPHESHIPFLLQFLVKNIKFYISGSYLNYNALYLVEHVDYNLYGMGLLHISAMKFRHPLPAFFSGKKCKYNDKQLVNSFCASAHSQADSSSHAAAYFSVWISSTVPVGWTWLDPQELSISPDQSYERFKRLSTCELEGDATTEDILNQHFKMFSSLSQTSSDVKMVQSLIPIWEEEYERNGMKEAAMPAPHSFKPPAEDVLKYLSHGFEFEKKFMELCYEAESSSNPCEGKATGTPGNDEIQKPYLADIIDIPVSAETFGAKASEEETLGLLKWLASSQAEEDINSDDDLACEIFLSPLLPATTINKVMEKANMDFEDELKRECQDILDSAENENIRRTEHSSADRDDSSETSSQSSSMRMVLQMDGPLDDKVSTPCSSNTSAHENTSNLNRSSRKKEVQDKLQRITSRHKRNEQLWGSLPFSKREKKIDDLQPEMYMTDIGVGSSQVAKMCNSDGNRESCGFGTQATKADTDVPEAVTVVGCSLRDLMRRKRSSVHDSSEFQIQRCKRVLLTDHQRRNSGLWEKSELHSSESDERDMEIFESSTLGASLPSHHAMLHELCDAKPSCSTYPSDRNFFGTDTHSTEKHATLLSGANVDDISGITMPPAISIQGSPEKENYEGTAGSSDECPRLLGEDSQERIQVQSNPFEINHPSPPKALSGFPAHYLNDGSFLYLLTPSYSPPSRDSVCRWIVHNERGAVADPCINCLDGDACLKNPALDPLDRLNDAEVNDCHSEPKASLQKKGDHDVKDHVDISQISGPEGKSKCTPLSQIGFKDPASVGCGQQLTLLSIEVLAESRGDLQPDPRYDAVNVISMAIKHDTDSTAVVYALLRSTDSYTRNLDGFSDCEVLHSSDEKHLFNLFVKIMCSFDPDILLGWDIQSGSLGFLAERASYLGMTLLDNISRTPSEIRLASKDSECPEKEIINVQAEPVIADSVSLEDAIIEDEWGRTHASGFHVDGRVVLNIWRLVRGEVKLNMYTFEAVVDAVLRRKIPSIGDKVLTKWFSSGPCRARYKCIKYITDRAKMNLEIIGQLDMINRTSELARVFGIDFFSVLSRGSQYRVESMLLRLAHTQNYIAISPGNQQVASQPAMECLPLVMEPESGFYSDPVVVLDFQSLYPSMIIGYNLCFCTCLGKVVPPKSDTLGVSSFSPESHIFKNLKNELFLTPNGVMYVPPKIRKGVLPRLLEEILSTRIMVKQALKNLDSSDMVLQRIFNARQLALKLIANVTYGYTAAGFSGRMPCAELADSIVQCGRRTLETAISFVHGKEKWKAKVIYGDTDSMFVLLEGRNVREAFEIGKEMASEISAMNPDPVTLKMEKVYHPCFLLTKKRYVGYSYERTDQVKPVFDAKGIETVRRDSCGAVTKTMEKSLRLFFEHQDIIKVRTYLQRQWTRILSGRVNIQDFVFAKEVRLGTYSTRTSSLPPAAIVATKAMSLDPRAEPRYGERVLYVVVHGEPGARLIDMVVDPLDLLAVDSAYRLNDLYYINKQIIPALQRVFGLVGANLKQWFLEMPRPAREGFGKRQIAPNTHKKRIDYYYGSSHCTLCGELVQASSSFCEECSDNKVALVTTVIGRTSKLERAMQHLNAICRHCGGDDWIVESGVKCTSLACTVFYERRKAQKELQILSSVASEADVYPKCMVEWF